jgi:hypothetical protein
MEQTQLSAAQSAYKAAVDEWITAIRTEESLAFAPATVAQVDQWEGAHFKEDDARNRVKAAKKNFEDALRESLFNF